MQRLELRYRQLEEGDIDNVNSWLQGWKLNQLPKGMYPNTGLILYNEKDDQSIYAGFVWKSNSKMAQIGFITRNPFYKVKLPKDTRKEFLKALIDYCKELGFEYLITWAENPLLVKDFKEIGLVESSNQCSELIAKIQ